MTPVGTRFRLARSVLSEQGNRLRAGRTVWTVSEASSQLPAAHLRSRSGLPSLLVVSGDGAHTAEVLEVDLRPIKNCSN